MTPESFLEGRLTGFGCVQGFTGKVLRRYTVQMTGAWSDEHRALHLDETYTYVGREDEVFQRSWVVHTDEEGFILGYDAHQAARFRGKREGQDLRMVFDRPRQPGGRPEPKQVVRFVEINPNQMMLVGRVMILGLPFATTHTALTKIS
jgi:hypothetical protein